MYRIQSRNWKTYISMPAGSFLIIAGMAAVLSGCVGIASYGDPSERMARARISSDADFHSFMRDTLGNSTLWAGYFMISGSLPERTKEMRLISPERYSGAVYRLSNLNPKLRKLNIRLIEDTVKVAISKYCGIRKGKIEQKRVGEQLNLVCRAPSGQQVGRIEVLNDYGSAIIKLYDEKDFEWKRKYEERRAWCEQQLAAQKPNKRPMEILTDLEKQRTWKPRVGSRVLAAHPRFPHFAPFEGRVVKIVGDIATVMAETASYQDGSPVIVSVPVNQLKPPYEVIEKSLLPLIDAKRNYEELFEECLREGMK